MRNSLVLLFIVALAMAGCRVPMQENLPPAHRLMHPGPGVDGPGPGVMMYQDRASSAGRSSQVLFVGPEGMNVAWDVSMPGHFDSDPLICPGRYNFPQGAIYRLKLTNIEGRLGDELYPTLEIGPAMPRTEGFLAHNAIPVQFTQEDFAQVLSGNFVSKVIYLPDPEYQELALAGVETLVSTRLDAGVDPIVEADRRGAILAIVRLGNKDLEIPSEMTDSDAVRAASYTQDVYQPAPGGPRPMGTNAGNASTMPSTYISGVNGPQYGMPMSGTPIGLPGPPHVPFGIPAGLQKHTIRNHTSVKIPKPTRGIKIDVKQQPGFTYPRPANHAFILERTAPPLGLNRQPVSDKREVIRPSYGSAIPSSVPGYATGSCDSGACAY